MISSDLHGGNVGGPIYNLGTVLTRVHGLTKMPWHLILHKTIVEPIRLLHIPDKELEIREGIRADLTVYQIDNGSFSFPDSKKEERTFQEKITARYTCIGPYVYACR